MNTNFLTFFATCSLYKEIFQVEHACTNKIYIIHNVQGFSFTISHLGGGPVSTNSHSGQVQEDWTWTLSACSFHKIHANGQQTAAPQNFRLHGFTQAVKQMLKCSKISAKYKPTLSKYDSKQKYMEILLSSPLKQDSGIYCAMTHLLWNTFKGCLSHMCTCSSN